MNIARNVSEEKMWFIEIRLDEIISESLTKTNAISSVRYKWRQTMTERQVNDDQKCSIFRNNIDGWRFTPGSTKNIRKKTWNVILVGPKFRGFSSQSQRFQEISSVKYFLNFWQKALSLSLRLIERDLRMWTKTQPKIVSWVCNLIRSLWPHRT